MKTITALVVIIIACLSGCNQYCVKETDNALFIVFPADQVTGQKKKLDIAALTPGIVKITVSYDDSAIHTPSLIAKETIDNKVKIDVKKLKHEIIITTDSLKVSVALPSGNISYYDLQGNLLLSEDGNDFVPYEDPDLGKQTKVIQRFKWTDTEAHFGLGQHRNGLLNIKGQRIELEQENTEVAVPFMLSSKGYGILWDNYSRSVYCSRKDSSFFSGEMGDKIQYYFIKSCTFDGLIAGYRDLTGDAPLYPRWAFGYMQSRNRYRSEKELFDVVDHQRRLNIPMDVIILDYYHWEDQGFGSFVFDEKYFPDPEKMIDLLHRKYHCKLLVSVWPSFTPGTKNWKVFNERNYLLEVMAGFHTQVYDAFNPDAGRLYYQMIREAYLNKGIDGWWFDATEPENRTAFHKSTCFMGKTAKYQNLYSYFDMKHVYESQVRETDKRIFILTRSAFSGQQQFATTVWSGDIPATFEELRTQIPAGLNLCMSGIPYWTTDIGGYLGGNPADPAYQELFTRWFQYGTFCPVFRAHGRRYPGDRTGENEMWSYGKEKQEILTKYINLRYRLLSYIYALSHRVTTEGYTIMRALPFDFASDSLAQYITDQFMFGNEILVCPVTAPQFGKRNVYLPAGTQWYDFWTGQKYEGGQTLLADAPIETIPLFVRSGSLVPMGPVMHYHNEKPADPVEIRIYPGRDASFTLYEDEDDNINYLQGKYLEIPLYYNEAAKALTIGASKGDFPGCIKNRTFHVVVVKREHGIGVEEEEHADRVVEYHGDETIVDLKNK